MRTAALPIACAIGGMIVPAALYWIFNPIGFGAGGWGIPIATDIAFALGALALIAPGAPTGARVFLTALAIVDDVGGVLVIATFFSQTIAWGALGVAGLLVLVLFGFNAIGVRRLWPYLLVGAALWYFVHQSGVHATVAGVALAFTIPTRTRTNAVEFSREARSLLDRFDQTESGDFIVLTSKGQQETLAALEYATEGVTALILRLEHALHKFSAFVVMPLFAFANAGVNFALRSSTQRLPSERWSDWFWASRWGLWRRLCSQLSQALPNFLILWAGHLCSVMRGSPESVSPCRCLSQCLPWMRLRWLTPQSWVSLPARSWLGSRAPLF